MRDGQAWVSHPPTHPSSSSWGQTEIICYRQEGKENISAQPPNSACHNNQMYFNFNIKSVYYVPTLPLSFLTHPDSHILPSAATEPWIFTLTLSQLSKTQLSSLTVFSRNPSGIYAANIFRGHSEAMGMKVPSSLTSGSLRRGRSSGTELITQGRQCEPCTSLLGKCRGRPEEGGINFCKGDPAGITSAANNMLLSPLGQTPVQLKFSVPPVSILTLSSFWAHPIQGQKMKSLEPLKISLVSQE